MGQIVLGKENLDVAISSIAYQKNRCGSTHPGDSGDDSGEAQNNQQQAPLQPNVAAAPAPDEIQVVDAVEVEAGAEDDVTEQDEQPS